VPSLAYNEDGTPHIHEYIRALKPDGSIDYSRYRCNHPDCTHWLYRGDLRGKRSLCSVCHTEELILTPSLLRLAFPRCLNCSKSKKAAATRSKIDSLKELFPEPTEPPAQ
jgi:hypothetical protein